MSETKHDHATIAAAAAGPPESSPIKGPVVDPETGGHMHLGPHSTQVYIAGQKLVRLTHGEVLIPPTDGEPAVILRNRA